MNRAFPVMGLVAAGLFAAGVASCAVAAAKIGINAAVRNKVDMQTAADTTLRPARAREDVHLGDLVASGAQSSLQMLLLDQSVFTVGSNARMRVDRFVYDPNRGTTDIAASVAKGAFRFMSGRLTSDSGREAIRTPVATIGVRGTIVSGAVGQDAVDVLAGEPGIPAFSGGSDNAVLVLLEGPGSGSQGFDMPGLIDVSGPSGTTTLSHGRSAMAFMPGQPVIGPFDLSDKAYRRLQALLAPGPGEGEPGGPDIGSAAAASGDISNVAEFDGRFLSDPQNIEFPFKQCDLIKQCH